MTALGVFTAGRNKKKVKSTNKKRTVRPYAREITQYQGYASMCAAFFKVHEFSFGD